MYYVYQQASDDFERETPIISDYFTTKVVDFSPVEWFIDSSVSRLVYAERGLKSLLDKAVKGDFICFYDIGRISYRMGDVASFFAEALKKKVVIILVSTDQVIDGTKNNGGYVFEAFQAAADIDKALRLAALSKVIIKREASCKKMGRPVGSGGKLKLDALESEIVALLKKGVSQASISKIYDVSKATLHRFIERRNINY